MHDMEKRGHTDVMEGAWWCDAGQEIRKKIKLRRGTTIVQVWLEDKGGYGQKSKEKKKWLCS